MRPFLPLESESVFVSRVEPEDGAAGVFRDALVLARLSHPVDPRSLSGHTFQVSDPAGVVPSRLEVSPDGYVVIWRPSRLLDPWVEHEVVAARSQYRTSFTMQAETTDGQARLLAQGALYASDWRWAGTFLQKVDAVTAADVQALAKKYLHKLQVVQLGDPSKLDPKLATSL